ncbi:MAG: GNAT family N-acetyltransferase [Actinomycetales bacterium]|nr:GNAT family N-acetyltransferase [Actinomycetales bacterium]
MPNGVRLARTSDVDDIAALQVAAWNSLYPDIIRSIDMTLERPAVAEAWADAILRPPSRRYRVLVATEGVSDELVGFAAIGPAQDPDLSDASGEIHALIVHPARLRAGHGSRLMASCVDHLRADGCHTAVTWTLLADEARRAFWQSAGWAPDSARRAWDTGSSGEQDGSGSPQATVVEVRLVTDITEPDAAAGG